MRSWAWPGGSGWRRGDAGGGCRPRGNETGRPVPERPVACVVRRSGVGAGRRRSNVIGPGAGCKGPAADRGGWYNQTVDGGGEGRRGDGDGSHCREGGRMSDDKDQVYGPERAQRLVTMLRALAERIQMLDRTGQLLDRVPELQKLLGNTASELVHYEVRVTYDTPDIAESRRNVEDAERARDIAEEDEDDEPWRRS